MESEELKAASARMEGSGGGVAKSSPGKMSFESNSSSDCLGFEAVLIVPSLTSTAWRR